MRLAVFSGQYFWFDGKHYSTDEAFVKFVTSFYPYFERIIFCDAVIEGRKTQPYVLDPAKAEVCPLPYFTVYSFWKNLLVIYPKIYRVIRDNIHHWDIIWLPAPHPVSLLFAYVCRRQRRPFFLVVRQNLVEQVKHRNRGIKRSYAMAVVSMLDYICQRIAERNLTFTIGKEMYKNYKRRGGQIHEVAVSLVSEKDIEDTVTSRGCEFHKPVRLLSIGRLDPEKGLHSLIEAIDLLSKKKHLDVLLQIVGKGLKDGEESNLRQEVKNRQLTGHIRFLGHVTHGPELFEIYRQSDIFILPSLTGEGLPQTLFEAMACGIPIIATKVAGTPYLIEDGEDGLLINPGSPREISDAVERLVSDPELRNRLVRNGLGTVRNHTLDVEREQMIGCINRFLEQVKL